MKRGLNVLIVVLFTAVLLLGGVLGYGYMYRPKIAYVRSHDLIDNYQGTREARVTFERQKSVMKSNVDSLRMDFERRRGEYVNSMRRLSLAQRADHEQALNRQQMQLVQYSEAIEHRMIEEDNRMMQEVLNQINSYVEEFAIREGYSFIFGTTLSGNLLYGETDSDITDIIVIELNNKYKGR